MKYYMLLIACCMLFLLSCSPAVAPKIGFNSVAQKSKIIYIRGDGQRYTLSRYLKVVNEVSRYDESGLFTAIVVFNNNRNKGKGASANFVCDVQFVFFDESGIELEKTNWQPMLFPPGVDTTVRQVSLNSGARDYKVYVKEPKTLN